MTDTPATNPTPDPPSAATPAPEPQVGHSSAWIRETTAESFEQDVINRSHDVPVVLDFWSPSCAPCQELTPILVKLVNEADGRWELVRINIDDCQDLATAFQVQSIPLLVAFVGGQPVDSVPGLLPEEGLREWMSRFIPSEASTLMAAGDALEAQDPESAAAKYREALALAPDEAALKIRLARVCLALGNNEDTSALIDELESRGFLEPEAQQLKDQLGLTESATETGGVAEAREALTASPGEIDLQLKLAEALAVERQFEEAVEICLQMVERDRDGAGQQARDTLVTFFAMPGADPEFVSASRRRLATLLY